MKEELHFENFSSEIQLSSSKHLNRIIVLYLKMTFTAIFVALKITQDKLGCKILFQDKCFPKRNCSRDNNALQIYMTYTQ